MTNFDWLKILMGLGTSNQSALFQHSSLVMLLQNLFRTLAPGVPPISNMLLTLKNITVLRSTDS